MRERLLPLFLICISLCFVIPANADDAANAPSCTGNLSESHLIKLAEVLKPAEIVMQSIADEAQREKDALQQCIAKLKKAALDHTPVFDSPVTDTDDNAVMFNELLKAGKVENTSFTRGQENAPAPNMVAVTFKLRRTEDGDEKVVSFKYKLEAGIHQQTQKPKFQFSIEADVKINGQMRAEFKQEFLADAFCDLQPYANQLTTFTYLDEQVRVRESTFLFPDEQEDRERLVPRLLVDNTTALDDLDSKKGLPDKLSLDAFAGIDLSNLHVEFEKQGEPEVQPDLVLGRVAPFQPYVLNLYQNGKLINATRIAQSTLSDSRVIETLNPNADSYSTEESVSRELWGRTPLVNSKEPTDVTLEGFVKEDFVQPQLIYDVKATRPLQYENLGAYSAVELLSSDEPRQHIYRFVDGQTSRPQLASASSPKYLNETAFFDVSSPEIQQLIEKVKQKSLGNKEAVALEILKIVNETIHYDTAMLNKESVRLLPASVVARRKSGVCQHFAALYVAMARSLGIPARAVNGYMFSDGKASLHAWVEISIDGKTWLPFEPQYKDGFVLGRGYVPLMVAEAYEAQKNSDMNLDSYSPMSGQKLIITKTIK